MRNSPNGYIPAERAAGLRHPDPDHRTQMIADAARHVAIRTAAAAVKKAKGDFLPVYDAQGNLVGIMDPTKLIPLSSAAPIGSAPKPAAPGDDIDNSGVSPVTKAWLKAAAARRAANEARAVAKAHSPRPLDAEALLRALGQLALRGRVAKSGARPVDPLEAGAVVRANMTPVARQRFDAQLAKTSLASRQLVAAKLRAAQQAANGR
jgi:hypothetical protein